MSFGNLSTTLWIFGISLLLFHLLALLVVSKKFWLILDYIWLAAVGLTIIAATGEVRRIVSNYQYEDEKYRLEFNIGQCYKDAELYAHLLGNVYRYENCKFNCDEIPHYKTAAMWYSDLAKSIKKYSNGNALAISAEWEGIYKSNNVISPDEPEHVAKMKKESIKMLDNIDSSLMKLKKLEKDRGKKDYEYFLLFLTPWIISVALALRIAKVTAAILELKREQIR